MDETVRVVGRLAPVTGLWFGCASAEGLFGGGFGAKGQPGRPGFVVDRAFRGGRVLVGGHFGCQKRGVGVEDGGLRRDRRRRAGMLRNLKEAVRRRRASIFSANQARNVAQIIY